MQKGGHLVPFLMSAPKAAFRRPNSGTDFPNFTQFQQGGCAFPAQFLGRHSKAEVPMRALINLLGISAYPVPWPRRLGSRMSAAGGLWCLSGAAGDGAGRGAGHARRMAGAVSDRAFRGDHRFSWCSAAPNSPLGSAVLLSTAAAASALVAILVYRLLPEPFLNVPVGRRGDSGHGHAARHASAGRGGGDDGGA